MAPKPESLKRLDAMVEEGWSLTIYPIHDPAWPVNGDGWRAELTWKNGNRVGCSMPTYAEAIDLLAGMYRGSYAC